MFNVLLSLEARPFTLQFSDPWGYWVHAGSGYLRHFSAYRVPATSAA